MKLGKKLVALATVGASSILFAAPVMAQSYDYYTYDSASAAAASGIFGLSLLVSCCVPLIGLIVQLVLAYVVYKDAKKNKVDNDILWAILTFFLPLIGILVYFLAIKPDALKKAQGIVSTPVEKAKPEDSK